MIDILLIGSVTLALISIYLSVFETYEDVADVPSVPPHVVQLKEI